MLTVDWMTQWPLITSESAAIWQTRLPRLESDCGRGDLREPSPTSYRCLVDHLPAEMSEADFRDLIGVPKVVPITWCASHGYTWCLVTLPELDALVMEHQLDGFELDDHHTLRCEAIGSGGSTYASAWGEPMPAA